MGQLEVQFPRYGFKHLFAGFKIEFNAFTVLFYRTLDIILRQKEVRLPKYRRKPLFTSFVIGFTTFSVLFLELW